MANSPQLTDRDLELLKKIKADGRRTKEPAKARSIRVTDSAWSEWQLAAKAAGLDLSRFIRNAVNVAIYKAKYANRRRK